MIQSKQPQQNVGRWAVVDWLSTMRITTFSIEWEGSVRKKYIWFIYDFIPTLAKKETRWSVRVPMYHARKHKDTRTKLTEEERKDGVFHGGPFAISQAICMSSRDKSWISEGKIRGYFDPPTFVCSSDRLPKREILVSVILRRPRPVDSSNRKDRAAN